MSWRRRNQCTHRPQAPTAHRPPLSPRFDAVIHFAGRKYVNESVDNPLRYYDHNVAGTVELCKAMAKHGCKNVSFLEF